MMDMVWFWHNRSLILAGVDDPSSIIRSLANHLRPMLINSWKEKRKAVFTENAERMKRLLDDLQKKIDEVSKMICFFGLVCPIPWLYSAKWVIFSGIFPFAGFVKYTAIWKGVRFVWRWFIHFSMSLYLLLVKIGSCFWLNILKGSFMCFAGGFAQASLENNSCFYCRYTICWSGSCLFSAS